MSLSLDKDVSLSSEKFCATPWYVSSVSLNVSSKLRNLRATAWYGDFD